MNNIFTLEKAKHWLFPILFYFVAFCALTYPLINSFHTHFFCDGGDGLQSVWDVWWVNKSVTELHQHPWHTTFLHYPNGVSLLPQTMSPFNGFVGIVLLKFLTLTETFNVIIIYCFVFGGVTAFWLSFYLTKTYWSSLIAGYLFTFSQFHFMHAEGHLQEVSLLFIPLFVMCWLQFMANPALRTAIIAAFVLFLVLLCDQYYFLFSVLFGIVTVIWHAINTKQLLFIFQRNYLKGFLVFIAFSLATSGILVLSLLYLDYRDPLVGEHPPGDFSLDLLAPFIPGGHWAFASLTEKYWSRLPGNINESSVYLGFSVVFLVVYSWFRRKEIRIKYPSLYFWYLILIFFGLLALGPVLRIAGKPVFSAIMPYTVFEIVFPPLKLSGCPVRMMVIVILATSVVSAFSLNFIFRHTDAKRVLFGIILGLLFIVEFLPRPIPQYPAEIPEYISVLKNSPEKGSLFDTVTPIGVALYHQTLHGKPLTIGYISRHSTSSFNEFQKKMSMLRQQNFASLHSEYQVKWVIAKSPVANLFYPYQLTPVHKGKKYSLLAINTAPGDTLFSSSVYARTPFKGSIDRINNTSIAGWAVIPGLDTKTATITLLLSDGINSKIIHAQQKMRPDVSEFHKMPGLYDHSGFFAEIQTRDLPPGTYRIGILIDNERMKTFRWSSTNFVSE